MTEPEETWRPIENSDSYEVSDRGRVRYFAHKNRLYRGETPIFEPTIVNSHVSMRGYSFTTIKFNNSSRRVPKTIHRLVAKAFIPNPENKPQVNHKNGIKTDNHVDNLDWMTGPENIAHALLRNNGCYWAPKGEKTGSAKLTEDDVRHIREQVSKGISQKEMASFYKVTTAAINKIVRFKSWKCVN